MWSVFFVICEVCFRGDFLLPLYCRGAPADCVGWGRGELLFLESLCVPLVRMSILVPIPCCPNYHGLLIGAILLCFQDLLVCSWLFAFPYKILHQLVNFYQKETHWDFGWHCIEFRY